MKHIQLNRLLVLLIALIPIFASGAEISRNGVVMTYEPLSDGTIRVLSLQNNNAEKIKPIIDGKEHGWIKAKLSGNVNMIANDKVAFTFSTRTGPTLWEFKAPVTKPADNTATVRTSEPRTSTHETAPDSRRNQPAVSEASHRQTTADASTSGRDYFDMMNSHEFFGTEAVSSFVDSCTNFVDGLNLSQNQSQFVIDHNLEQFLTESGDELEMQKLKVNDVALSIVYAAGKFELLNVITETLNSRLEQREVAYNKLNDMVLAISADDTHSQLFKREIINYALIGGLVLILAIWFVVAVKKRKKVAKNKSNELQVVSHEEAAQAIVVRRRTTSILKKQCLDDVFDNPEYLKIEASEFTVNSAVRNIYIKNSCIKDVYDLYAEDLRNAENPKEDGCMVLGRWVLNESAGTYDVSLEEVIFPGDDAVFKEYELNFGGKIKLRIAEKLRKLRRDTNLQYDLTCWIHSHPGLGVFFSNSDSNVQMQLKHSQHPNFLVAFVIDILTSKQELGIFTFRPDGSIISKNDITKMYSLEDMYKWALESGRKSFSPENYYNLLANAPLKAADFAGIELNNNAIIDLAQLAVVPDSGLVGWAVGFKAEHSNGQEYVVSSFAKNDEKPATGVLGCVVSVTHMSLPTIQRLIASECANIGFVLVYSTKLMTLTTIPIINGEIITDERFYQEVNIDDLKIWTRRKR